MKKQKFVVIVGSLRKESYNKMLMEAAQKAVPDGITIEILPIEDVPLYNADLHEKQVPESVDALNDAIKAADALIFATPEYNYSVPGVLKNVIDHVSSSPKKPFQKKVIGIVGASTSILGTARAQYHLRQMMVAVDAFVLNKPEIMVSEAKKKFDEKGSLKDDETNKMLVDFLKNLSTLADAINK
jgi:chromate reductase, NAD(P)H dehydrogenase (quinone)